MYASNVINPNASSVTGGYCFGVCLPQRKNLIAHCFTQNARGLCGHLHAVPCTGLLIYFITILEGSMQWKLAIGQAKEGIS